MDKASIKKLEADLWESADLLRAGSKLTSNQYCMPVLGLLFLRYAHSRYKMVEEEILKDRPVRNGRKMPVEASDFTAKSALFLPKKAQFDYTGKSMNRHIHKAELSIIFYLLLSIKSHTLISLKSSLIYEITSLHKHTA